MALCFTRSNLQEKKSKMASVWIIILPVLLPGRGRGFCPGYIQGLSLKKSGSMWWWWGESHNYAGCQSHFHQSQGCLNRIEFSVTCPHYARCRKHILKQHTKTRWHQAITKFCCHWKNKLEKKICEILLTLL